MSSLSLQISYGDPMNFGDGIDFLSERLRGKAVNYRKIGRTFEGSCWDGS